MTDAEEAAYTEGQKAIWRNLIAQALRELGRDSPEWTSHRWVVEREETVAALRRACRDQGDNDWPDDLHLVDVIEKHLLR
jgi:hypothetical protein